MASENLPSIEAMATMHSLQTRTGPIDFSTATDLLVAQQVRSHLLNPNMNARPDRQALQDRVQRSFSRAEKAISVLDAEGKLCAFALLVRHELDDEDLDRFFMGSVGLHTQEFVVPSPEFPDADAIALALIDAIWSGTEGFVSIELPIGSAWCEQFALQIGFLASGVESIRQPYQVVRNSIPLAEGLTIRTATQDDLDALLALMMEEWNYLTAFHPVAKDAWNEPAGAMALASHIQRGLNRGNSSVIVAELEGEVVGMVILSLYEVTDVTNPLPYGTHVMIEDISVRSSLQGRGVGRGLVRAVFEQFKDRKIAGYSLGYVADNPIARRLWPHLGFRAHKRSYVRKA